MYSNSPVRARTYQTPAMSPPFTSDLPIIRRCNEQSEGWSWSRVLEALPGQASSFSSCMTGRRLWRRCWESGGRGLPEVPGSNCTEVFEHLNNWPMRTSASWLTICPAWRSHEDKISSSLPGNLHPSCGDRGEVHS